MRYVKVYVETVVRFVPAGGMRPMYIVWEDGARYDVDRVRFVERAPARVGSVLPVRYTCVMGGQERYLYFEPDGERWFVEKPV